MPLINTTKIMDISEFEYFEGPHKKIPLVIKNGFKVCINFGIDN